VTEVPSQVVYTHTNPIRVVPCYTCESEVPGRQSHASLARAGASGDTEEQARNVPHYCLCRRRRPKVKQQGEAVYIAPPSVHAYGSACWPSTSLAEPTESVLPFLSSDTCSHTGLILIITMASPQSVEALTSGHRDGDAPRGSMSLPRPTQEQQQSPLSTTITDSNPKPKFDFMRPSDSDDFHSYESEIKSCDSIARSLGMGEIKSNKEYYLNRIKKKGRPKHWKDPHRTDEQLAEAMELIRRSGLNTAEVLRMSLPASVRPPMPDYNAGPDTSDDEEEEKTTRKGHGPK